MGILSARQKAGLAALVLAASAFLSRLMGLARDKIISWQFGASGEADMYFAAFVIPDIINYLLAGGFMSITIIPLLARGFEVDEADAWKFFSCILIWMTAASIIFTGMGEIFANPLAAMIAPGFSEAQRLRLAFFMRLILPGQIFFLVGACFTALLFLRRQFAAPALTPLIYNGLIIVCGLVFPLAGLCEGMTGYCIGVTIGAALGAFLLPFCAAAQGTLRLGFVWFHPWLWNFLLIALPLMLGQTVVMLDEQFLRIFGSMLGEGSVSLLNYARRIAQVPVALMGQAIAVASYPFLVRLLAKNETDSFNQALNSALAAGLELIIPVCLWMLAFALPILTLIFQGGRFGPVETLACEPLAQIMLAAGPVWIIYMVLVRGFYAHGDTLTPAVTGTLITLACIPVYRFIALGLGAWAIAVVSGLGLGAYALWLMLIWKKRHGPDAFVNLGLKSCKCIVCALPAALFSGELARLLPMPENALLAAILTLGAGGLVFCALFLCLAWLIYPELPKRLPGFLAAKRN